jgi:hypothetical protein
MSVRGAEGAGAAGAETAGEGRSKDGGERRAGGGQRLHFEALVAVGENGGGFEAESVDVSPDGMRLRTAYLPEVGDKLVCRFDGMGTEIAVDGEVLWRTQEAKGGEFGLRFVGLDDATASAVRAMCMTLGDPAEEAASAEEPIAPRGARVRLHIEGLGSPMKARVRDASSRELSVGSNLEFLKVGRSLEIEDVDQGSKREAMIDAVKVDVDPATNVPQLVVTLRFDKAGAAAEKPEKKRTSAAPVTRRAAPPPPAETTAAEPRRAGGTPKAARPEKQTIQSARDNDARDDEAHDHDPPDEADEADGGAARFAARAASAGRAMASKVGPALAGAGLRARGAMNGVMDLVQKRRAERAETKKAEAPRRTTAPAPRGALTSDGRRLVRDDGLGEEDEVQLPLRSNRRSAAMGGTLGLCAVLAIFGTARFVGRGHSTAVTPTDAHSAMVALTPPAEAPAAAPGTPTANVPLFGQTPLSTTEPAPGPAPSALASAAPAAAPPGADSDEDGAPGDASSGRILKEWGQGSVSHPIVLKIKMDGAIEKISGAAGAMGFTISVPGRRSVSSASDLTRKDKRLASVNVVNTSHGAEISVQFKDGVPPYLAKVKGDRLEIAIGKEGHSKVAKKKKKKATH